MATCLPPMLCVVHATVTQIIGQLHNIDKSANHHGMLFSEAITIINLWNGRQLIILSPCHTWRGKQQVVHGQLCEAKFPVNCMCKRTYSHKRNKLRKQLQDGRNNVMDAIGMRLTCLSK